MRQLILIAGVVGVLMYAAAAGRSGIPAVAAPAEAGARAPEQGLGALQKSLEATGASLDEVIITGWGRIPDSRGDDRVRSVLGWTAASPQGETRSVAVRDRQGQPYVTVRWVLIGKAASRWEAQVRALQKALDTSTTSPSITVQLGGTAASDRMTELTGLALSALAATDRQAWSDARATSVAGRTTHLPPGPFGVNVQAAVRRDPAKGLTRVWVAWPALLQEY